MMKPYGVRVIRTCLRRWNLLSRLAGLGVALAPAPAAAHGGRTGVDDLLVDYGLLAFAAVVVFVGAAVLAWLSFHPPAGPVTPDDAVPQEPDHQAGGGAVEDSGEVAAVTSPGAEDHAGSQPGGSP